MYHPYRVRLDCRRDGLHPFALAALAMSLPGNDRGRRLLFRRGLVHGRLDSAPNHNEPELRAWDIKLDCRHPGSHRPAAHA